MNRFYMSAFMIWFIFHFINIIVKCFIVQTKDNILQPGPNEAKKVKLSHKFTHVIYHSHHPPKLLFFAQNGIYMNDKILQTQ